MGNDTSEKWGEMREVVTDSGLFYYQIEKSTTFDYLHLFTKKTKRTSSKLFGKEFNIKHTPEYTRIPGDGWDKCHYLKKGVDRIGEIKKVINKAINEHRNFDPVWDGIMCEDKALLRDILIEKILEDEK
jgi:hypothetical protein